MRTGIPALWPILHMNDYMNNDFSPYGSHKKKGKGKKIAMAILGAFAPLLIVITCALFIGSGAFSALASAAGFWDALFGVSIVHAAEQNPLAAGLENLSTKEMLEVIDSGKVEESYFDMMLIKKDDFRYLLQSVEDYNNAKESRTIQIEAEHVYTTMESNGSNGQVPVTHTEYPYREILVNSKTIETFKLDWQLVYVLCLTDLMNGNEDWSGMSAAGTGYSVSRARIDDYLDAMRMQYDYVYDLVRDEKDSYTLDECQALVHTPFQYGDPDTETGQWTYYIPRSLLRAAYSGYAAMYYLVDDNEESLTDLLTAADMDRFDFIASRYSYEYSFGYVMNLLGFIPGGGKVANALYGYADERNIGSIIKDRHLTNYIIGSGIDLSEVPTSKSILDNVFEEFDYGDIAYDGTIGTSIVRAAARKIGCTYSQARRWEDGIYDCSSFVWRILEECGINPNVLFNGNSTAAEECRALVNKGMVIPISDIQPGDIIFYSTKANGRYRNVTHVAIYAGNGEKIHARSEKYGVVRDAFSEKSIVCVCRPYLS